MKQRYFDLARNVSTLSDFQRIHIGCVVLYKGKVIGSGYNCCKSHPLQRRYNRERFSEDSTPHSMHAELHALCGLRGASIDWNKVILYVYRQRRDGSLGCARPCKSCLKLIKDMGIHHICYTTDDGYAEEVI